MDSLTLKHHNSFQNENKRKARHSFVPNTLVFKFQQVLKFNDTRVSLSSSKTDVEMNLLNLENRNFESVTFSQ